MTRDPDLVQPGESPADVARQLADDARVALGRVRESWPRLAAARLPGSRRPVVDRPAATRAVEAAAEQWRLDRAAAREAVRHRRVISGYHPAPGNLDPIHARHEIGRELTDLSARLWSAAYAGGLVLMVRDPAGVTTWCTWCHGTGEAQPPHGWEGDWPASRLIPPAAGIGPPNYDPPIPCSRCDGGRIPAGDRCPRCGTAGRCRCERADVAAAAAMTTIADLLDLLGVEPAADAEWTLLDCADLAERTLRTGGPTAIRLHGAECPVCGARDMFAATASPDPREWSVRCQGPDCLCGGPEGVTDGVWHDKCPCGIATVRREGRRHVWPSRVWDGPTGLAHRLGVALPGTRRYTGPRIPRRPATRGAA